MYEQNKDIVTVVPPNQREEVGFLSLPLNKDQFTNFIKSLLGSPQTINNTHFGIFEVSIENVKNFDYLLTQRITQQNAGVLVNFAATIIFSDNSSLELHSIEQLETYREVRPIISVAIHLLWDFIINFPDSSRPEKQRVQLSILTKRRATPDIDGEGIILHPSFISQGGKINFRIEHTDRTWGADIEAILTNSIKGLMKPESKLKRFIRNNGTKLGAICGLLFFLSTLYGCNRVLNGIGTKNLLHINEVIKNINSTSKIDVISRKVDYLAEYIAKGDWLQYNLYTTIFIVFSVFLAILFAYWISELSMISERSFLLLTKESEKEMKRMQRSTTKEWLSFFGAIITSLLTGILTNYICLLLFK